MNYFPFHVGDYVASTAHLSWDEDMAYTRLIRVYYQTEKPIPKGQAYRLARATTPAQRAAVDSVLSEFFTTDEADGAFRQSRCDEEICKFNDKQSKAKRSANTRWERAKTHSEGNANASKTHMRTHSEGNANQEPITKNQEDISASCARDPDLDLERQLREAAGWQSDPSPNLLVTGPIVGLIASGTDLETDVLPVVRALAPRCRGRKNWNFFIPAIVQARDARIAAMTAVSPPAQPMERPNDRQPRRPHCNSRRDNFAVLDAIVAEAKRRED